ncbi:SDR family NAD(P)-dependent oxidoreductase [Sulfidibacter corallicola]|uniref:SDR family NAD(P)-dependent oxidoreductase n=1 Tax=Sulfidibacter corallicola TaxID=2818388 RepID=A0A8A4TLK8_SULCO|nr:SDR family NAD(P)-dependent oxidoreductase [Sulfidibacter corallicola]QTD50357.1 SDR family NAD(P)-dependent oxidoreductase [Sulfidibacter corallicola]
MTSTPTSTEPASIGSIAIVGMSCRLPGADDLHQYWRNLRAGVCSVRRLDRETLRGAGVAESRIDAANYVPVWAGIEEPGAFDAGFFGIPPSDAEMTDPQHRLFLECAWHALEDAALDPRRSEGRIGVFAGAGFSTYLMRNLWQHPELTRDDGLFRMMIQNGPEFLATRTAFKLDLKGPAISVGTSCSTSLAAVHMACRSLLDYQCDAALAGGVRIMVPHHQGYLHHSGGVLSSDGKCRAFDAAANGTVPSSGAGVLVLKRLEDALADRDAIYAVIRGSALNNDGAAKAGFYAPSVAGQAEVIAEAHLLAGVDAADIDYVETHGTGTALGDPIEIQALTRAFSLAAKPLRGCTLGSVKTNVGHLDTASGAASLIKTALMLHHGDIPPSLHFATPNPRIDFETAKLRVNRELDAWPERNRPRRAAVSAFGVGGTNVHLVLEEAPRPVSLEGRRGPQVLLLSAPHRETLSHQAHQLADYLEQAPETPLADVAYTLAMGRRHFARRHAIVVANTAEALARLRAPIPFSDRDSHLREGNDHAEKDPWAIAESVARDWTAGGAPDAAAFSGRRLHLPGYPFQRRTYWIDPPPPAPVALAPQSGRARVDTPPPTKRRNVADWFYLPSWRQAPMPPTSRRLDGDVVLFGDRHPLVAGLETSLVQRGARVHRVHRASEFGTTDAGGFHLDPCDREQVRELFDALDRRGCEPTWLIHAWPALDAPSDRAFRFLLHLAAVVALRPRPRPMSLLTLGRGMLDQSGDDPVDPLAATMLGPLRVMPQESPHLRTRCVDLHPDRFDPNQLAERLAAELFDLAEGDPPLTLEIAYRGRTRWARCYQPWGTGEATPTSLVRRGGVYLITGGLGELGLFVADHLARIYDARLILTSRHPEALPSRRAEQLASLKTRCSALMVAQADCADRDQMGDLMSRVETTFGALNGVIHAAGITGHAAFRHAAEVTEDDIAPHWRAKVNGTQVLGELLAARQAATPLDFVMLFSSLSTVLGGMGFSVYAAANAYLDAYASQRNREGATPWISVAWDGWRLEPTPKTGPEALLAYAIDGSEGDKAFACTLQREVTHLVVSTANLDVRRSLSRGGDRPKSASPAGATAERHEATSTLAEVKAAPARGSHPRPPLDNAYQAPSNEIEAAIAEVWQELFAIESVGIEDGFFDLGGDSVLAARIVFRVNERLGSACHVADLFEAPTVSALAEKILADRLARLDDEALADLVAQVEHAGASHAPRPSGKDSQTT